jgi:hypothetical protein
VINIHRARTVPHREPVEAVVPGARTGIFGLNQIEDHRRPHQNCPDADGMRASELGLEKFQ